MASRRPWTRATVGRVVLLPSAIRIEGRVAEVDPGGRVGEMRCLGAGEESVCGLGPELEEAA
jgi:hypothetical protein